MLDREKLLQVEACGELPEGPGPRTPGPGYWRTYTKRGFPAFPASQNQECAPRTRPLPSGPALTSPSVPPSPAIPVPEGPGRAPRAPAGPRAPPSPRRAPHPVGAAGRRRAGCTTGHARPAAGCSGPWPERAPCRPHALREAAVPRPRHGSGPPGSNAGVPSSTATTRVRASRRLRGSTPRKNRVGKHSGA